MIINSVKKLLAFIFLWMFLANFSIVVAEESNSSVRASVNSTDLYQEVFYNSHNKRDPFIPLMTGNKGTMVGLVSVESISDINLEGLIYDPEGISFVVANGVVLEEGEQKEHVKVVSIKEDGAEFSIHQMVSFKPFIQKKADDI